MVKKIFIVFFYCTGLAMLVLAFIITDNSDKEDVSVREIGIEDNSVINIQKIAQTDGINVLNGELSDLVSSSNTYILYVVKASGCGACINEVREYNNLLRKKYVFERVAGLIYSQDENEAKIDAKVLVGEQLYILYGYNLEVIESLIQYSNYLEERQILFVKNNRIVYRSILPKGMLSDIEHKKRVLKQGFASLNRLILDIDQPS